MIELMQDRGENLQAAAHRTEQHAKFGNRPPMRGSLVQRMLPARSRFPTDHLPEGSH